MKITTNIIAIAILLFTGCKGQANYFQPTGIINKTKELSGKSEWVSLNDKERVDGYTKIGDSIFGGEIACDIKPLINIDIKTFKVWAGSKYAKDKDHVYYPLESLCIDDTDCGVCYYTKIIVENADPSTFKYMGNEYAADNGHAWFRGKPIAGADGATFKTIEGPEHLYFAMDKNNVYCYNVIFAGADPATFYYDKSDPRNSVLLEKYVVGDKNKEWQYLNKDAIKEITKQ